MTCVLHSAFLFFKAKIEGALTSMVDHSRPSPWRFGTPTEITRTLNQNSFLKKKLIKSQPGTGETPRANECLHPCLVLKHLRHFLKGCSWKSLAADDQTTPASSRKCQGQ